jgi:alpha-beta hydrolase superfamily lysophospholipase
MKTTTSTFTTPDGTKLFTQAWLPDRPRATVILQHGLGEHIERYDYLGRYLTSYGYATYAADARGHGQTGKQNGDLGYFASLLQIVADLHAYVQSVANGEKVFLIGHSMGGLISLLYTIHHQETLKGLVLSAPALDAGESVSPLTLRILNLLARFAPKMGTVTLDTSTLSKDQEVVTTYQNDPLVWHGKIPARVGAELIDGANLARAKANEITIPVLLMHGANDRLVNPKGTPAIYEQIASADKTLKLWDGLNHEIFNEPEKDAVIDYTLKWILGHLA